MSYSIFYNSFNINIADKKWENFDVILRDTLDKKRKMEELQKKLKNHDEYGLSEEEIYDPQFREQAEKKSTEIIKAKHNIEQELQDLEVQNPAFQAEILYYIQDQTPVESDIIVPLMIELDLLFGGKIVSYHSALDPINEVETTLRILFPELNLRENEELKKEDWITIFKHFNELDIKFETHKKELLENKNLDVYGTDESKLMQWKNEMKSYLLKLRPTIEEVAGSNAQFFSWTDSEGYPDSSVLRDRARKHIEEIKEHSLMRVPLQDHEE